ncbi:Putative uncharacterized protein [Taphrina deformans PYCC 5710]|uniref:Peptidase S28 n=1 Tax=Taphrina deformans (strain PYCC 5710 / ATCC 11124 / CBS 356.35 / IMI 108563 / JCM 9778 / NBRC 8474) TaxID=1097556 RepID=R4X6K0_TAPDE|nr:Putative uncharacterized protein [Taphrina deformans PYCC 5710]|eukprot:CCG80755.1 Putative uncharacterized protein [Taphrina deformans PYCC 5710]
MLISRLLVGFPLYFLVEATSKEALWTTLKKDQVFKNLQYKRHSPLPWEGEDIAADGQFPAGITQHFFQQRLNHFNRSSAEIFPMRYWKSLRHYREGGPIIVVLGGEVAADLRVPVLDYGIVDLLARETHGMGIVLEHRYYGRSIPVPDYTTKNMKWLTIDQALEDVVNFAQNVNLGFGEMTNSPNSPWFLYGGSYAGAQAAFLRARAPDVIFGSIASSAVVIGKIDFWEYRETIRRTGGVCSEQIVQLIAYIDDILNLHDPAQTNILKDSFGLGPLNDLDFVQAIQAPFEAWQAQTWEKPQSQNAWLRYCDVLAANVSSVVPPAQQFRQVLANFQKTISSSVQEQCPDKDGRNQIVNCYGTIELPHGGLPFDLGQTERPWAYLSCTSLGFFTPAAPAGVPSMISRLIDPKASNDCAALFDDLPAAIPASPDLTRYNKYGELALSNKTDRIMFVDGERDPWLYATAHSPYAPARAGTEQNPFELMRGAVHRWDESGVRPGSGLVLPAEVERVQRLQVSTTKQWLDEWHRIRFEGLA